MGGWYVNGPGWQIVLTELDVAVDSAQPTGLVPAAGPRALVLRCRSKQRRARLPGIRSQILTTLAADPRAMVELRYEGALRTLALRARFVPKAGDLDPASDVLVLRFEADDQRWSTPLDDDPVAVPLATEAAITAANYALERGADGLWRALGGGPGGIVRCLAYGLDGKLYAGGDFGIKVWNGAAWATVGGNVNGTVNALAFAPDGSLYAGGSFTQAGGLAVSNIARWRAGAWSAMAGGLADVVYALAFVSTFQSNLYVGLIGGLRRWSGAAWSSVGTINGTVFALAASPIGELYLGGSFTSPGNRVAVLQSNGTLAPCGAGQPGPVFALALFTDGRVAAGGMGGVGIWNGQRWEQISTNDTQALMTTASGGIVAGALTTYNLEEWTGALWALSDHQVVNAGFRAIAVAPDGRLATGFSAATGASVLARTTVVNDGTAAAPLRLVVRGPGYLQRLVNLTTGAQVFLDFALVADEVLTLDLDTRTVTSSVRVGSQLHAIQPGSRLFQLAPGVNEIGLFMTAGSAAAELVYWPRFWSADSADA